MKKRKLILLNEDKIDLSNFNCPVKLNSKSNPIQDSNILKKEESTKRICVLNSSSSNFTSGSNSISSSILFIVLDTETTGLSCYSDHIVEFASIGIRNKTNEKPKPKPKSKHSEFILRIRPGKNINPHASKVHKIYDQDVANAPDFTEVYLKWSQWIIAQKTNPKEPVKLIAHNGRKFDFVLLCREIQRSGFNLEEEFKRIGIVSILDSVEWFRQHIPLYQNLNSNIDQNSKKLLTGSPKSYKLTDLFQWVFGREMRNAHSALADTKALAKLLTYNEWNNEFMNNSICLITIQSFFKRYYELTQNRVLDVDLKRKNSKEMCLENYYTIDDNRRQCRQCFVLYSSRFPKHSCQGN